MKNSLPVELFNEEFNSVVEKSTTSLTIYTVASWFNGQVIFQLCEKKANQDCINLANYNSHRNSDKILNILFYFPIFIKRNQVVKGKVY